MLLDLKKIFGSYDVPIKRSTSFDLSGEDFPGYDVPEPVAVDFTAAMEGSVLAIEVVITAQVQAQCARCLEDLTQPVRVCKTYYIRDEEWAKEDTDLTFSPDGKLDVRELAYQELILEVSPKLLCSDYCEGLCPVCGKPKSMGCSCETAATDDRLSILKQLLT